MLHRNHQFGKDSSGYHIGIFGATKFLGNYAFNPTVGWYRINTLAIIDWQNHIYKTNIRLH